MEQFLQGNSSMLVPAAIALGLMVILLKIAIAVERALLRIVTAVITVGVLVAVLVVGVSASGRLHTIQAAADSAMRNIATAQQGSSGGMTADALTHALDRPTRQAFAGAGLDPRPLDIHAICEGRHGYLHLRYADTSFLFGVLSSHDVVIPLPPDVRCKE